MKLQKWPYQAQLKVGNASVFLLGTTHRGQDKPIIRKAFSTFRPDFVLMEGEAKSAEQGGAGVETLFTKQFCQSKSIPYKFMGENHLGIFLKLKKKYSLFHCVVFLTDTTMGHFTAGKCSGFQLENDLRVAARENNERLINVCIEPVLGNWLNLFLDFLEPNPSPELERDLKASEEYGNLVRYWRKNIARIYKFMQTDSKKSATVEEIADFSKDAKKYREAGIVDNYDDFGNDFVKLLNTDHVREIQEASSKYKKILVVQGASHMIGTKAALEG